MMRTYLILVISGILLLPIHSKANECETLANTTIDAALSRIDQADAAYGPTLSGQWEGRNIERTEWTWTYGGTHKTDRLFVGTFEDDGSLVYAGFISRIYTGTNRMVSNNDNYCLQTRYYGINLLLDTANATLAVHCSGEIGTPVKFSLC